MSAIFMIMPEVVTKKFNQLFGVLWRHNGGGVSRGRPNTTAIDAALILYGVILLLLFTSFNIYVFFYLLHLYPGFNSYTKGATWKILDLLTETLLIQPSITVFWSFC